jgi:putative flippase GtrA
VIGHENEPDIHAGPGRSGVAGIVAYAIGMVLHFVLSCRYVFNAA